MKRFRLFTSWPRCRTKGGERSDAGLTEDRLTSLGQSPSVEAQCDRIFQVRRQHVRYNGTLRPAAPLQPLISRLWRPGDRVRWRDRIGVFRRDVGDSEHAEIVIADRTYRVRLGDLA